jgi:L-ectoine synthase
MIVRALADVEGSSADVTGDGWRSLRLLTRGDQMGFTITHTTLQPGMEQTLEYRHHLEACLCVSGHMQIENLATGDVHEIVPGTMCALDQNDRHVARVLEPTILVCVFNPALTGTETHDASGGYGLPAEDQGAANGA